MSFNKLNKAKIASNQNKNIIKTISGDKNTPEDILISYDLQAGSYTKNFYNNPEYYKQKGKEISNIINNLNTATSILEVGVGEASTLIHVLQNLNHTPSHIYGFDISWSRLNFAQNLLKNHKVKYTELFTSDLFNIPLPDSSIDVIYTCHSLEPNGGREKEALKELYRVAKNQIILLEPSYELASYEAKKRMEDHGYVTNLQSTIKDLGYDITDHYLSQIHLNPLNPTGITIITKNTDKFNPPLLKCPISYTSLNKLNKYFLHSPESFLTYPILEEIPCLLKENAILSSKINVNYNEFKKENNIQC